jgi:multidrug efflux pump subunit AcrB
MVSLTLTPMMCSRFLTPEAHNHGRIYTAVERMFDGMLRFYERTLDIALRYQFITLMAFVATVTLTGVLYVFIPKGFFPTQDTGIIVGITDAAQDISFDQMSVLQRAANNVVLANPSVASSVSLVGAGGAGQTANNGRMYITLKPWTDRQATATQVIAQIDNKMQAISGIRLFMQPSQDVSVGASTNIPYRTPIRTSSTSGRRRFWPR